MASQEQHSNAAGESPAAAEEFTRDLSMMKGLDLGDVVEVQDDRMVGDGAVDVRGRACIKSKSGNWRASALIFGCEACERVGFNAISANLVGYLTMGLGEDLPVAVRNANNWCGTVRLTPVLAAVVADSYLGRFMTIGIFMAVFLLGEVLVATSASVSWLKPSECSPKANCPPASGPAVAFFYCSLYLMALGAGGSRACVFPFAGDQFDVTDRREAKRKTSTSNWYFIALCSGNLVGVAGVVYAQARLGWSWGYGIPAAITAVGTLAYLGGASLYRNQVISDGSPVTRVAQVLVAAARNWRVPAHETLVHDKLDTTRCRGGNHPIPQTPHFSFLDKAATPSHDRDTEAAAASKPDPWKHCPAHQVEEVKMLVRMLPIWLTNIMFWVVYAQVSTLFLNQGTSLDRRVGPGGFQIPAASMPLFLNLSICAILPVYSKIVVPLARKFTGEPQGFSVLQRIGIGQAISVLPIAVAALVEVRRLRLVHSLAGGSSQQPLPMSIFWLLPQYALMGFTEVFLSIGQIEFFTNEVPHSMRSLGNAMAGCAVALGCFGSSMLVDVVTKMTNGKWIQNNVNESRIDYFFWLLTTLTLVNLAVYLVVASRYRNYSSISDKEMEVSNNTMTSSIDRRIHPISIEVNL